MKKFFLGTMLLYVVFMSSCAVYVREPAYVPVQPPPYYTLRVFDDRYVFYSADEPVAVWTFGPDGTFIKEGVVINGPVRVYYQPGVLFAETYYVNGYRDGVCRYYYPGGGIMYSGYYSRGYMSGSWSSYNTGGVVSASFQFHGTETAMPAGFQQPAEPTARVGFQAMQREAAYAGSPVVNQPFNKAQAVPINPHQSFGAMSVHAAASVNGAAVTSQPPAASAQGTVQAQGMTQAQHPAAQAAGAPANGGAPQNQAASQAAANQPPQQQAGSQAQNKHGNKKQFNRQKAQKSFKNNKKQKPGKNKFKSMPAPGGTGAPGSNGGKQQF